MKKKLFYIVLVWLAGIGAAVGQVTGKVILLGETNHSGIKIKFVAQSPSAKTDSTFTSNDGLFSLPLKSGNYIVTYSKIGYPERKYKNGDAVLITSDLIFSNTFKLIKKENYLKGIVSGVLKSDDVYIVDSSITVLASDSLIVNKGVILYINDNAQFEILGKFKTKGVLRDSVYFLPISNLENSQIETKWKGFRLSSLNFSENNSEFYSFLDINYTSFRSVDLFLYSQSNNLAIIKNSYFSNINEMFRSSSALYFENNVVNDCKMFSYGRSKLPRLANVSLVCNRIKAEIFYEFPCVNLIAINNDFDCPISSQTYCEKFDLNNNIFRNSVDFVNFYVPASISTEINRNTFSSSSSFQLGSSDFSNNIFLDNVSFINDYDNIIFNNKNLSNIFNINSEILGNKFPSIGQKITTNVNGDSVDTYFNLFQDPKFLNGTAPYLAPNSPAIGAGIDENGKPVNIGFDPTGTCLESYFPKPNPVITADTLSIAGLVHQGSGLLSDGVIIAVEKASGKARYQKVSNGVFKIDSLRKSEYILYAVPNPVTVTGYLPTYYVNKVKLSEAISLNLLGKIKDVDIYLVAKKSVTSGNSTIQGRFSYADNNTDDTTVFGKNWFGNSNAPVSPIVITENPCKNLPVLLYNGNNQLVQSTVTDIDGYFGFQNISSGTYKALGQRVNYSTENSGEVVVNQNSVATTSLRLERIVDGIEDELGLGSANVSAYPNPFKDELQLKGYNGKVSIYDLAGNLYFETTLQSNETINSSNWPSGFYLLKTGNMVQKLIKQE